jgi:subtilisin family serine protease
VSNQVAAASARPTFGGRRPHRETVPGQYVLRVHPGAVRPHIPLAGAGRALTTAAVRALPDDVVSPLEHLADQAGLTSIEPLFETPGGARRRAAAAGDPRLAIARAVTATDDDELAGLAIATVQRPDVSDGVLKRIRSASSIDYIEPVPTRWLAAAHADPLRNLQWGLRAINWFEAARPDGIDLAVGVMDTGIDARHPDLAAIDVDYDHNGTAARDLIGHGTHVAGIITAVANNDIGITGVTSCRLAVWKIFDDSPADDGEFYVDTTRYYRALGAAATKGIAALNLSIGGSRRDRTEGLLLGRLVRAGVTVCAAMGNEFEDGNPVEYPAAFKDVVSVGAIAENRRRASFSNTGRHINLMAPGSHILSTLPRQGSPWLDETNYAAWSGTSMATPHVTATAALVAAANSAFGPAEVAGRLEDTAVKLAAMRGRNFTQEYGRGLLDLRGALS